MQPTWRTRELTTGTFTTSQWCLVHPTTQQGRSSSLRCSTIGSMASSGTLRETTPLRCTPSKTWTSKIAWAEQICGTWMDSSQVASPIRTTEKTPLPTRRPGRREASTISGLPPTIWHNSPTWSSTIFGPSAFGINPSERQICFKITHNDLIFTNYKIEIE